MVDEDTFLEIAILLSILQNEEELIIKPFQFGDEHGSEKIECGKIVSRFNKHLFNYQIGERGSKLSINSFINRKITLNDPENNEIILELYHNRLPFLSKVSPKQDIHCILPSSNGIQSIASIQQKLAFAKIWYDIYNHEHEHVISLILRKNYLRSRIQHRVPEFEIVDHHKKINIGRIYPFSTALDRSDSKQAVAIKIPKEMNVETKASLLMVSLALKSRIN